MPDLSVRLIDSSAIGEPLLAARGISKRYGDLLANDRVDLEVRRGEIHALLGENGSGKTTLLSALYGLIAPDEGEIVLEGRSVRWASSHDARRHGIALVPQDFRLVPTLNAVENVAIAAEARGRYRHALAGIRQRLARIGDEYGLDLKTDTPVGRLSVGERQRLELLRALYFEPAVLLLDEPTSVLTRDEAEALYSSLKQLVRDGRHAIVLTTHRIREVFGGVDAVSILRRGRKVADFGASELEHDALVRAMVGGRDASRVADFTRREAGSAPLLRAVEIGTERASGRLANLVPLRGVDIELRPNEVLGIAGVEGNGQLALEFVLAGMARPATGRIEIRQGDEWIDLYEHTRRSRAVARRQLGYIPSDRVRYGVANQLSVHENLLLPEVASGALLARAPAADKATAASVSELIQQFDIQPPKPDARVGALSGGNAQKVVLARELSRDPLVTIAAQPTTGLDVAAASLVRRKLREQSDRGRAVLLISSDLDELLELCDRITVMFRGRLVGTWSRRDFDIQDIGHAMAGTR